jgi:hypothetical protein
MLLRRPPVTRRGPGLLGAAAGAAAAPPQPAAPGPAPRGPGAPPAETARPAKTAGVDLMSQLQQLVELKAAGTLTEAEFTAAKARLLDL